MGVFYKNKQAVIAMTKFIQNTANCGLTRRARRVYIQIMKTVGRTKPVAPRRGFTPELNEFLKLCARFRRSATYIPAGVYRFSSFEEANAWNMKMLLGKRPEPGPPQ